MVTRALAIVSFLRVEWSSFCFYVGAVFKFVQITTRSTGLFVMGDPRWTKTGRVCVDRNGVELAFVGCCQNFDPPQEYLVPQNSDQSSQTQGQWTSVLGSSIRTRESGFPFTPQKSLLEFTGLLSE